MLKGFDIRDEEWAATPQSVKTAVLILEQQLRLFRIRFTAYEQKITALEEKAVEVESLRTEVAALRERLGQNSRNSSLPPSSDPPQQQGHVQRKRSRKRRGGQPGHRGHRRQLKPVDEVDHFVDLRPDTCRQCGRRLKGSDPHPSRHQVAEIPPARAEVTEYRRHTLCCLHCGTATQAAWGEVTGSSFGPRAQAVVAYLTGRLSLSQRDTVEAMQTLHGVELSLGSVSALQRQVSAALAAPVETARQYVRQQWTNYVDETGWKEQARQCWLWLNSTRLVTAFQISRRRDQRTARQVIGRVKTSIITTDRHNVYSWLGNERRQLCWAHLKRDFQAVAERGGESQRIGRGLLRCTKEVFDLWHQSKVEVLGRVEWQEKMQRVSGRVKRWLERGGECGQRKTRGLCRRLLALERALWTFVRVEGVEPTNNQAERGLRRAVLWRRKSFGTQSREGSRFVERVLTAVTSLRQQGRDVLEYLTALCQPQGNNERPICLLPDTS